MLRKWLALERSESGGMRASQEPSGHRPSPHGELASRGLRGTREATWRSQEQTQGEEKVACIRGSNSKGGEKWLTSR